MIYGALDLNLDLEHIFFFFAEMDLEHVILLDLACPYYLCLFFVFVLWVDGFGF
ncbi:hypothetical protein CsatA_004253 [Cannabis sativa]